jgi:hypothetical protein
MNSNKDLEIYRGDKKDIVFLYPGDIAADKIIFVVKADRALTSARLIEKKNDIAGGDGATIISETEGIYTRITIKLLPAETQALNNADYYYDVIREDAEDATDYETLYYGLFTVEADVQTPYDNAEGPTPVFNSLVKRIDWKVVNGTITREAVYGFDDQDEDNLKAEISGSQITLSSTAEFNYEGYVLVPQREIVTKTQNNTSTIVIVLDDVTGTFTIRWESYY